MGGSSGGGGGKIGYPSHIAWWQKQMMSGDETGTAVLKPDFLSPGVVITPRDGSSLTLATIEALRATNIYTGITQYDPSTDLSTFQASITRLTTFLDAMSSETDWDTLVTNAIANVDEALFSEAQKEEAIRNFKVKQQKTVQQSYNRLTGIMNDIGAVNGTAFLGGVANIEAQFNASVAEFRSATEIQLSQTRVQATLQNIKDRISGLMQTAQIQGDWARISITSQTEEIQENLKIDKDELFLDFEIFQAASNVMASMGSGTAQAKSGQSSKGGQIAAGLSGAISGAAAGVGTGPLGIAAGAIGGAIGGFGG